MRRLSVISAVLVVTVRPGQHCGLVLAGLLLCLHLLLHNNDQSRLLDPALQNQTNSLFKLVHSLKARYSNIDSPIYSPNIRQEKQKRLPM